MDKRRMEGNRELHDSLTAEVVETWERGDGISFPNKGVSAQQVTAMPVHTIYILFHSLCFSTLQLHRRFFLSDQRTIRKERGNGGGSVNKQKEEESLICLGNVDRKLFWQRRKMLIQKYYVVLINLTLRKGTKQTKAWHKSGKVKKLGT